MIKLLWKSLTFTWLYFNTCTVIIHCSTFGYEMRFLIFHYYKVVHLKHKSYMDISTQYIISEKLISLKVQTVS